MAYLIGIDIGTSSAKAILYDTDQAQTIVVSNGHEYPIHKPAPDRAEQDPDDWWRAAAAAVREVTAEHKTIAGISFSGQMHGTVFLNDNHQPIHPAIIWADQRSGAQVQELKHIFGDEKFAAIAGTLPAAGFMASTLFWIKQHQPDLLEQAAAVIPPKDYVRLKMTGEVHTELSDGAGTALFDIQAGTWSDTIIEKTGLPRDIFPQVIPSTNIAGELTPAAAAELGLSAGIPIIAGCADQPAQSIGNGLITPGTAAVSTGTGGQAITMIDSIKGTDPRLHIFNHAIPGMWYILGAILSAGLSLRWLRDVVGLTGTANAYAVLSQEAAAVAPGADGLTFLPYLSGERTPHMDPQARGGFIGLNFHHKRGHLARAVMEGVSFALRQALEISAELSGGVDSLIVSGGGAESDVWRQIQADVFGVPLQQTTGVEQSSVGAALLAGVGAGVYSSFDEACKGVSTYGRVTAPIPANVERYNERYQQFLRLYPLLKDEIQQMR